MLLKCRFTSIETVGLLGMGAQDVHLDFHTAQELLLLKCCLTSTETVGLLGTEAQDVHLDFHTAPELSHNSLACHKQLTAQNLTKPNNWANPIS